MDDKLLLITDKDMVAIQSFSQTNRYQLAATSDNTRRAYQADIRHFEAWGGQLPASTSSILRYLNTYAEKLNPRTLSRHITALKQWHLYQNFADPTQSPVIAKTLSGIARTHGKPKVKARPLLTNHLIQIVKYLLMQTKLSALRDNALLQIGFLGALRRSELVKIRMENIIWQAEGIEIVIPKSKTDQFNTGQYCAIPYGNSQLCAVRALKAWINSSQIDDGYVFRRIYRSSKISDQHISADIVNRILKNHAVSAGIEGGLSFSSHSMRRGLATSASLSGVALPAIMRQGRWKQVATMLEYIEAAQRFEDNAAGIVLGKLVSSKVDCSII